MTREIIRSDRAPRTGLPYAQAVRVNGLVFVAGQVALDPATASPVGGDIRVQTRRVLDNIAAILESAGTSLANAVDSLCFLKSIGDYAAFNETYREYFDENGPPRTTVQASLPRDEFLVEIRIVAAMPGA